VVFAGPADRCGQWRFLALFDAFTEGSIADLHGKKRFRADARENGRTCRFG
jgi:hypothetical protein